MKGMLILLLSFSSVLTLQAQQQQQGQQGFAFERDTLEDVEGVPITEGEKARLFAGRPGKAALFSLIVPGAGQAYNGRWWKVPLVWGAVGGVGYWMVGSINDYQEFRDRYYASLEAQLEGLPPPAGEIYSTDQLRLLRNNADRRKQTAIFAFAGVWLIQSIEAYTDAHLQAFDISDDLSLHIIIPEYDSATGVISTGIALRF